MEALNFEIHRLSLDLRGSAGLDGDVKLLMTIPGVGYYTALLIKAEIGDVNHFKSGKHYCSFIGIVPSTYSSGGVIRHGGITHEGNPWLRWAYFEADMTMLSMIRLLAVLIIVLLGVGWKKNFHPLSL